MATHTAIVTTAKGEIATVQVPTIAPGPSEVLIKIEYAALIPFDTYVVDLGFFVESYPARFGCNAAGTVIKVGKDVQGLAIGDQVFLPSQLSS